MPKNPHKILLFDIEADNLDADWGTVLCIGYQWFERTKPHIVRIDHSPSYERNRISDKWVVEKFIREQWNKADAVVSWYGQDRRYDEPFLKTKLLMNKSKVYMKPVPHIDLYTTSRNKLKLSSNRLANFQRAMRLSETKTPVDPYHWKRARAGYQQSLRYIVNHCIADIKVLEESYRTLRPYIAGHPNLQVIWPPKRGDQKKRCPRCSSKQVILVGHWPMPTRRMLQYRCKTCGGYARAPEKQPWKLRP